MNAKDNKINQRWEQSFENEEEPWMPRRIVNEC